MATLRTRHGLQGLEGQGVFVADQPGLVARGQDLAFFSLRLRPPAEAEDPLALLMAKMGLAITEARKLPDFRDLHLYYLDTEGNVLLSLGHKSPVRPELFYDGGVHPVTAVQDLMVEKRFEAWGRTGERFRHMVERKDVFVAVEKYLAAYQLGWGGLFNARDQEDRAMLFRHFDPDRSGVFKVEEKLVHLVFTLRLVEEGGYDGPTPYRTVSQVVDSATLDEALAWA